MRQCALIRIMLLLSLLAAVLSPLRAVPSAADQAYATAKQLFNTGHDQQAIPELKKFVTSYPADPRVHDVNFMLGRSYQRMQQWEPAQAAFTLVATKATAPELVKLRADAYFQLAECEGQQRDYENAAVAYRACLKYTDDDDLTARAQYWLGECFYRLGRYKEALPEFRKVADIAPKHQLAPWGLYSAGMIELRQGDYNDAIALMEQVTAKYADSEVNGESTLALALAYAGRARDNKNDALKQGDYTKAQQLLTTALADADLSADSKQQAALAQAQIYADQQNYDKAAATFTKLLGSMDQASAPALTVRLQLGDVLYNAEKFNEAAKEYAKVAESKAPAELTARAIYWLGNSQYQQGLKQKDKAAYTQAAAAFKRFIASVGVANPQASRATLLLGLSQEELATLGDAAARTDAVNTFKDVLEKWPASREAGEARSGIARLTSDMTPAELEKVAGLLPDGAAAWSVSLRLAREHFLANKYQEAITAAQKVLDSKPTDDIIASAAYLIAAAYHRLDRPKDAIPFYKQVLDNTKAADLTLFAQRGIIKAYLDTQRFPEARDAARALTLLPVQAKEPTEREKELAERYILLAEAYTGCKQYPEATSAYQRVTRECASSPLVPYALMGLGWIAETKKDRAASTAAYQEVIVKFPEHKLAAEACYRLGMNLNEQKDYQRAIEMLQKVPADYPQADQAAYAIAWAYRDLNKPEEANTAFGKLAEQFPKSPLAGDSLYRIGEYWMEQKNDAEAMRALNRAVELLPADSKLRPTVVYRLGVCALKQQNYALAATTFDRVLADFPTCEFIGESLFWKGQALEQQGTEKAAAARDAYLQYQAKFPAGPLVLDAAVGAGRAALANKQYATARTDLQKALDLCTKLGQKGPLAERAGSVQPEAQFTLGQCAFEEKKYDEALKKFAAVAGYNMEPWYSRSMLQMARCSALTNDTAAAARTLRLLIKSFPDSDAAKQAPQVAQEYKLKLDGED